jgi:hypothetical protein
MIFINLKFRVYSLEFEGNIAELKLLVVIIT